MEFFLQQTINGLTLGSVYALLALGYSMVYGVLKFLNFAHGEVYMFGAFAGYGVLTVLGGATGLIVPVWLAVTLMFVVAIIVSSAIGLALERFAYRPLRSASRLAPLISAIGASFFLQAAALLLFSANSRSYDTPRLISIETRITLGPVNVWAVRVLVIVTTVIMMILLTWW
ncbi:MAG TPA: branched-chain amino acid ABC transporter permease, partial [Acidimicrobiia bacterium]|nr:branched-chain amino acid ABC transporter permease [Acidimicrobiia bacterium]